MDEDLYHELQDTGFRADLIGAFDQAVDAAVELVEERGLGVVTVRSRGGGRAPMIVLVGVCEAADDLRKELYRRHVLDPRSVGFVSES
jgi:hypothetical protein